MNNEKLLKLPKQVEDIASQLESIEQEKVDKVTGKGLSTFDYDNNEKSKVATIPNKADIIYVDNKVATLSSATPIFVNTTNEMTNTTRNYVLLTDIDGYIYTHNGTTFVKSSVKYQSQGIGNNSVMGNHLTSGFNYKGVITNTQNANDITSSGVYLVNLGVINIPSGFQGHMVVNVINDRWVIQELYELQNGAGCFYARTFDKTKGYNIPWTNVREVADNSVTTSKILDNNVTNNKLAEDFTYVKILGNSDNLNNLVRSGDYLISGTPQNMPIGFTGTVGRLTVSQIGGRWIEQRIREHANLDKYWIRQLDKEHLDWNVGWNVWEKGSSLPLNGDICVHFGDSITGNYTAPNDYPTVVANKTGMTTYNVGFGGAKMSYTDEANYAFNAFTMCKLADAIVSRDFSYQDANVNGNGIPSYYVNTLTRLKTIDFTKVKYITIFYGTNDFRLYQTLDNDSDKKDITTFAGALRYSLEKIQTAYPHIRVLLITPWYRYFFDSNNVITGDSDTQQWNKYYLWQFVDKEIEIAKEFKVPVLDMYRESGVNKFNRDTYFLPNDGTHPNTTQGIPLLGGKISSYILSNHR